MSTTPGGMPDGTGNLVAELSGRAAMVFRQHAAQNEPRDLRADVLPLDQELTGAVLRFLSSIETGVDRRVLALIYLRELVCGVLRREQYARLLAATRHPRAIGKGGGDRRRVWSWPIVGPSVGGWSERR